jgi:hypothetical protein
MLRRALLLPDRKGSKPSGTAGEGAPAGDGGGLKALLGFAGERTSAGVARFRRSIPTATPTPIPDRTTATMAQAVKQRGRSFGGTTVDRGTSEAARISATTGSATTTVEAGAALLEGAAAFELAGGAVDDGSGRGGGARTASGWKYAVEALDSAVDSGTGATATSPADREGRHDTGGGIGGGGGGGGGGGVLAVSCPVNGPNPSANSSRCSSRWSLARRTAADPGATAYAPGAKADVVVPVAPPASSVPRAVAALGPPSAGEFSSSELLSAIPTASEATPVLAIVGGRWRATISTSSGPSPCPSRSRVSVVVVVAAGT